MQQMRLAAAAAAAELRLADQAGRRRGRALAAAGPEPRRLPRHRAGAESPSPGCCSTRLSPSPVSGGAVPVGERGPRDAAEHARRAPRRAAGRPGRGGGSNIVDPADQPSRLAQSSAVRHQHDLPPSRDSIAA
jgi:hypothetical protein